MMPVSGLIRSDSYVSITGTENRHLTERRRVVLSHDPKQISRLLITTEDEQTGYLCMFLIIITYPKICTVSVKGTIPPPFAGWDITVCCIIASSSATSLYINPCGLSNLFWWSRPIDSPSCRCYTLYVSYETERTEFHAKPGTDRDPAAVPSVP